jgi:hypothetical protein
VPDRVWKLADRPDHWLGLWVFEARFSGFVRLGVGPLRGSIALAESLARSLT